MSENQSRWCVLLPCSAQETWAVPQNCLAEVVTLKALGDSPPRQFNWRGREIPVLDKASDGDEPWRDAQGETGLVAVFLGLEGQENDYWAVALRGSGLAAKNLATREIKDCPEGTRQGCTSAFEYERELYQVPDLPELQKQAAINRASA